MRFEPEKESKREGLKQTEERMNDKKMELLAYVAALEKIVFKQTGPADAIPTQAYVAELERRASITRNPQTEAFKKAQSREMAHKAADMKINATRKPF